MSITDLPPTRAIAEWCAELSAPALPEGVRELAAAALVAMATAAHEHGEDALSGPFVGATDLGTVGPATVLATGTSRTAPVAAEINAACASLGHARAADQLADVVAAAALAAAEAANSSDLDLLAAVGLGLEVASRVALALGPSHLARGWHLPGTAGRIGAAAAASKLSGHDAVEIHSSMAYTSTEAAGLAPGDDRVGAMVIVGRAAHDGVEAAVLAAAGLLGPVAAFEGRRGLLALLSDASEVAPLTEELGSRWRSLESLELTPPPGSTFQGGSGLLAAISGLV